MVNLAKAGPAVLVPRPIAMVLDAKAAYRIGALLNIRNGIDVQIIHHVAGIVVDADAWVVYLAHDLRARLTRAGGTTVLLDDDKHAMVTANGAQLFEPVDPDLPITSTRMTKR